MPTIRRPSTARQIVSLEDGTSAPASGPYALGETSFAPIGPSPPSPGTLPFGAAFSLEGGNDGQDGLTVPGPPGPAGSAGSIGPVGPQGPIGFGIDGLDGEEGLTIPGAVGPTGPPGALGPQGSIGIPGSEGDEGPMGLPIPGPMGLTGATGATGAAGTNGAMALVSTQTVSGAATVDFTGLVAGYNYVILGSKIANSTASNLYLLAGTGAGPTWDTGSTSYNWYNTMPLDSPTSSNSGGTQPQIKVYTGNATNADGVLLLHLNNPGTAFLHWFDGSFSRGGNIWGGSHLVSIAITGVRLLWSAGTISGTFSLYTITI